jgi:hypothetical protein
LCSFNIVGIKTAERKENPGKDEKIVPILSDLDISSNPIVFQYYKILIA